MEVDAPVKRGVKPLPKKEALRRRAKKVIERTVMGNPDVTKYYNTGEHRSPVTWTLDSRWADLGLRDKWTPEKIFRMCDFLKIDIWELASILNIDHNRMEKIALIRTKPVHEPTGPEATVLTNYCYVTLGYDFLTQLLGHVPREFFQ